MKHDNLQVVVIGNIINETIQFPDRTLGPVLGSPAAYSSLVIARTGRKVGLVTYYGDDLNGGLIQQLDLVDNDGFIKYDYSTQNYLVYRPDGSKYVKYVRRAPNITFKDIPEKYLKANTFYICPMDYEVEIELIKKLFRLGKTVIVDLGGYGGATSHAAYPVDTEKGKKLISDLCKYSSIIKASEEDMTHITPGMDVHQIADYFLSEGAKIAVLTLGKKGAMFKTAGGKECLISPCPSIYDNDRSKLDFTGAGDSFGAGLVSAYSETKNINQSVIYGNGVASLVIEKSGGCTAERMPTNEMVINRINGKI